MEPLTYITAAIAVSTISGGIGFVFGGKNKVDNNRCKERQSACSMLLVEKIDHLTELVKKWDDGN